MVTDGRYICGETECINLLNHTSKSNIICQLYFKKEEREGGRGGKDRYIDRDQAINCAYQKYTMAPKL